MVAGRKYFGLRVRSLFSDEFVKLPSAISRPHLSLDPSLIPTPETVESHAHLRHLSQKLSPLLDCQAGLLIGYDCAEALIASERRQGFAVRSRDQTRVEHHW